MGVFGTGMLSNMATYPSKTIEEYREICARPGNEGPCPTCICKKSGKQRRNCNKPSSPSTWSHFGTCDCKPCSTCRNASCCPKCWKRFDFTKTEGYNYLCTELRKDLEALNVGDRIMVGPRNHHGTDYNLYKKGAEGVWRPAIYKGVDAKKNMIRVTFDASPTKTHSVPLDIYHVRLPGHQRLIQTAFNEQKRQFTKYHVCRE